MKPRAIKTLILTVLAGFALLLGYFTVPEEISSPAKTQTPITMMSESHTELTAGNDDLTKLRNEIARLHRDMKKLRHEVEVSQQMENKYQLTTNQAQEKIPPTEPSSSNDDVTVHDSSPYADIPPDRIDHQIMNDLDYSLSTEPKDHKWGEETTNLVFETTHRVGTVLLDSAVCASTLCRVEMTHEIDADPYKDLDELVMQPPWNTDGYVHVIESEGEPTRSIVYFTRSGYTLPAMGNL